MKLRPGHPDESEVPDVREAFRERLARIGCHETLEHLHRHVEGETEPFLRRLVEEHLSRCPACRAHRALLEEERLWFLEEAMVTPSLSAGFRKKILERVESRREEARRLRWRDVFFRASGVAAVLAVAVIAYREAPLRENPSVSLAPATARATAPAPRADGMEATEVASDAPGVADLAGPAHRGESPTSDSSPFPETHRLVAGEETVTDRAVDGRAVDGRTVDNRTGGIPYFGEVVHAAATLGRPGRPTAFASGEAGPCLPDPNRDGKMDPNDVAFSCQVLMGGKPPALLDEAGHSVSDPDCEDLCLRV